MCNLDQSFFQNNMDTRGGGRGQKYFSFQGSSANFESDCGKLIAWKNDKWTPLTLCLCNSLQNQGWHCFSISSSTRKCTCAAARSLAGSSDNMNSLSFIAVIRRGSPWSSLMWMLSLHDQRNLWCRWKYRSTLINVEPCFRQLFCIMEA